MTDLADPPPHADLLQAFLRQEGATCPACRYDLRDLNDSRCPECGKPIRLAVQLTHSHVPLLVASTIGLATGFGFTLFLLITFVCLLIAHGAGMGPSLGVWGAIMFMLLVEGAALALLCLRARRFARATRSVQAGVCALAWALSLFCTGVVITLVLAM